ncbi:MAG TPA: class I adenylate-forming enzyme family protein, partial [Gemmatimonadales bacterium]|nr:class I adenylate-forming enzyme family protein [Gemmatimonadales bacterium]
MPAKLNSAPEVTSILETGTEDWPVLLPDLLHSAARQSGGSGGAVCGTDRRTYAEIDLWSERLGRALIRCGVRPGDRVVTVLPNCLEFLTAAFGVWKARGVFVPEYTGIPPVTLGRILADARPTALIVDRSVAERLEEIRDVLVGVGVRTILVRERPPELSAIHSIAVESLDAILESDEESEISLPTKGSRHDIASITYTSGSTGTPKGVMHSHESWLAAAEFTRDFLRLSEHDAVVIPLPLHHALTFRHILAYLLAQASIVITADIYQALKSLRELRPTALLLVPAACHIAIDHFASVLREAMSHLRYVEIGSAATTPERLRQLRDLLPRTAIHVPYGLTEARVAYLRPGRGGLCNRINCTSPGLSVGIVHPDGSPVAPGETGEILIQGRGLMVGYWAEGRPEDPLPARGFRTGDVGRLDYNGDVDLLGRLDEVLKIGGRKVNPAELELVLTRHPDVREAAVVGGPDPNNILENVLHAFVVPRRDATLRLADLMAHCRHQLESYKVPVQIHIRPSLPKSSVGKLLRSLLV